MNTVTQLPPHVFLLYREYLEMPGLSLSRAQARRLAGLNEALCSEALNRLVAIGFLRETAGGHFVRLTDGPFSVEGAEGRSGVDSPANIRRSA